MPHVKTSLALLLIFTLLSNYPAQAADLGGVYENNQLVSAQWVNWRPATWERNEEVQALASQLLLETGSRETAPQHIYDWIRASIAYDWEALAQETYTALLPSEVLRERKAVCEGIANLTQVLLLEAGIPCIKVWGVTITEGTDWCGSGLDLTRVNHTWNEFYMSGRWVTLDCTADIINDTDAYFDPDEAFFAQTHKRLRRGDDALGSNPSAWAIPEISQAVDAGLVPLEWLSDYHRAVTAEEWLELTGLGEKEDVPMNRLMAADSLAPFLPETASQPPYSDIGECTAKDRQTLAVLYETGIMTGCDGCFLPNEPLTRQAAIAVLSRLYNKLEG